MKQKSLNKSYSGARLKVYYSLSHSNFKGTEKDYYIALGLNFKGQYEFPIKKFFWRYWFFLDNFLSYSSNDFKFAELPAINPEYKDKVGTFRQPFIGKPEEILINVTGDQGFLNVNCFIYWIRGGTTSAGAT